MSTPGPSVHEVALSVDGLKLEGEHRNNLSLSGDNDQNRIQETARILLSDESPEKLDDKKQEQVRKNAELLSDPENQDKLDLATQILVDQNLAAFQKNANILLDEHLEDLGDATEAWWTTADHVIPTSLIEEVDENVLALLPEGTEVISIDPHGTSNWSRTAEIQTELHGEPISYFIKVNDYSSGRVMYRSEFESLKVIHKAAPGFCPEPIAWGEYSSNPDVRFLLCHFVDMLDEPPDVTLLPPMLAELHAKGAAPDGKYGFPIPVAGGPLPLKIAQSKSWEAYFVGYLRYLLRAEEIAQGPRPAEMDRLLDALFNRIIPRLLRPLETGGREIVPRILHTDLWDGNTAVTADGEPVIFDPCSMFGHNEFDLGVWSNPRMMTGPPFVNSYHNHFERSAPEEDHSGRNILYAMAFETRVSATIAGHEQLFRNEVIRYMTDLDERYPESYEEWATSRGEQVCPPKEEYRVVWP